MTRVRPGPAGGVGRPVATLVLAVVAASVAACGPGGDAPAGPTVEVTVSPTPAAVGSAQIRVRVADAAGAPVEEATVVVHGSPEDAGNGPPAPVVDTADAFGPGLWVVQDFPFAAAGSWRLEARVALAGGDTVRGHHTIRVVGR